MVRGQFGALGLIVQSLAVMAFKLVQETVMTRNHNLGVLTVRYPDTTLHSRTGAMLRYKNVFLLNVLLLSLFQPMAKYLHLPQQWEIYMS